MTIAQSAREGDAAVLSYYLEHTPPSPWLFDKRQGLSRAITDCHPAAADTLSDWLRKRAQDRSATTTYYRAIIQHAPSLAHKTKLFVVLHHAGFKLAYPRQFIHPKHIDLLDRLEGSSLSAHARIEMLTLEPNPDEFLTRDWWKPFYSTRVERFRGDIDIWQRGVLDKLSRLTTPHA